MNLLIKDEKAFRQALQTDDRLWQAVKACLEANAQPRSREHHPIFKHPASVVPSGSVPGGW